MHLAASMVTIFGPAGMGETHLVVAVGRESIWNNYRVQFITAATLMTLAKAYGEDGSTST